MLIDLVKVKEFQKPILSRLIELYEYDFSEFNNNDISELGLYGYSYLDCYFTDKNRYAYFVKVNNELAGFVMVNDYCYVSKEKGTSFLSEFFIMKKYRKNGVGSEAARQVFNMHKGNWELTVYPKNKVSVLFWEKIIKDIMGSNYQKHLNIKGIYDDCLGIAYTFNNSHQLQ